MYLNHSNLKVSLAPILHRHTTVSMPGIRLEVQQLSGTGVPAERLAYEEDEDDVQAVLESRFVSLSGGLVI